MTKDSTIKGPIAKVAGVVLFVVAAVMVVAAIFPTQATNAVDSLDRRFGGSGANEVVVPDPHRK